MSRTVTELVAAGVAYLDEHDPGWWRRDVSGAIDLKRLDVGDGTTCILGQRCPAERLMRSCEGDPFKAQLRYITRGKGNRVSLEEWPVQHGFDAGGHYPGFSRLTAEWRRVISERRKAGGRARVSSTTWSSRR